MNRTTTLTFASLVFAFVALIAGCATSERATKTDANSTQTAKARPPLEPVKDVNEAKLAYRA